VSQKNIPDIFDCNLKINFGINIAHTTDHQIIINVSASPNVCFCTTWENKTSKILHFYSMQYYYLIQTTYIKHILSKFLALADTLFNFLFVQLLTANIPNIDRLCKHKQGGAFSIRWYQCL